MKKKRLALGRIARRQNMNAKHSKRRLVIVVVALVISVGLCARYGESGEHDRGAQRADAENLCPLEQARKLIENGRYSEAEEAARELLSAAEDEHGVDSLEAAKVLDVLVQALLEGGRAKEPESLKLARRAVALKEELLEGEHPEVATSVNNLAQLFHFAGEYQEARPLYERAIDSQAA